MAKSQNQRAGVERKKTRNSGEITLGEIREKAEQHTAKVSQTIQSEILQFCEHAQRAFFNAQWFVEYTYDPPERPDSIADKRFLHAYFTMKENLRQAKKLLGKSPDLLNNWPKTPNINFGPISGVSVLAAMYDLAERVEGQIYNAHFSIWDNVYIFSENDFYKIVPSDNHIGTWFRASMANLQENVLPPAAQWPTWQRNKDLSFIWNQLENEKSKADLANKQKTTPVKEVGKRRWKPPNNYIGSKEIDNKYSVPRTTLQGWQERDKLKVKKDPQTQENYYPRKWFEKHLKDYKPRKQT